MGLMDILTFITEIKWALVVLIILLVSGNKILDLIASYANVEFTAKPIKLTLKRLEEDYGVSKVQVKKLRGLTGHDLWALQAFLAPPDDSFKFVDKFTPQRKAIIFSFNEMGLVEILEQDGRKYVKPTKLAREVLDAANKLL